MCWRRVYDLKAADGEVHGVHGFPPRQLLGAAEDADGLLDHLRIASNFLANCTTLLAKQFQKEISYPCSK